MSEIRLPGQSPTNPLVTLASALAVTNQHLLNMEHQLKTIAGNTFKEARHVYALAEHVDDTWGSYCLACSEEANEYVFPCTKYPDRPRPPSVIAEVDRVWDAPDRSMVDIQLPDRDGSSAG